MDPNSSCGNFKNYSPAMAAKASQQPFKNPQANTLIECIHGAMGEMLSMQQFNGSEWVEEANNMLQTVAWALPSTVHT